MAAKPDPRIRVLMEYFDLKYKEAKGIPYSFTPGKDAKLIKMMLGTFSEERIRAMIDQIFKSNDSFISDSACDVGVLYGCRNRLAQECRKPIYSTPKIEAKNELGIDQLNKVARTKFEAGCAQLIRRFFLGQLTRGEYYKANKELCQKCNVEFDENDWVGYLENPDSKYGRIDARTRVTLEKKVRNFEEE